MMAQNDAEFTKKFGRWIVALRKRLGMTQLELGQLVGTNKEPVGRWEGGGRTPAARNVLRLLALATEQERAALMDKAMEGVADTITVEGTEEEVHCAECGKLLRVRDYAVVGWPAPPVHQTTNDPYAVRLCVDCSVSHGWPR